MNTEPPFLPIATTAMQEETRAPTASITKTFATLRMGNRME